MFLPLEKSKNSIGELFSTAVAVLPVTTDLKISLSEMI